MSDFELSVYHYLQTIPYGRVVSYGQIALAIGNKNAARAVGNALHKNLYPDIYPCYKVVNAKGELARHFGLGIQEQKKRLEKEGIEVINYKVDKKYFWNGK